MKPLFFTLITSGLVLAAATSQAQSTISFGPRLGGNLTTFSYSGTPADADQTNYSFGVQVGGTLNVSFGNFAFQPSLLFTQKGAEQVATDTDNSGGYTTQATVKASPRLHYLELPLNFVYTVGGEQGFQVFAGPYVAMGIGGGGTYNVTLTSNDPSLTFYNGTFSGSLEIEHGSNQNPNTAATSGGGSGFGLPKIILTTHRFDAGFNAGIGYRVGPVQAQLGYGLGLVNFVPNDENGNDTGSKAYNRGFQLAATYFFSAK